MFASLTRVLSYAVKDFFRNAWLSITTVLILTLTLVSVQVLLTMNVAGQIALEELESRVDLRIQFLPTMSEAEVDAIRLRFQERPEVLSVEHRSRATVLEEFQSQHAKNPDILEALVELGENPFGPELRVRVRSPQDFPAVVHMVEDPSLADRITETGTSDRALLVERLQSLTARLRLAGLGMSAISFIVTLLIIINAMRIATYARREEVGIMKLVGATNWFVRTPFLIMGIIAAALATVIVQLATLPILRALTPTFNALLGPRGVDVELFFRHHIVAVTGAEFLGLAFLTIIIASLAIRRYLRV